jgi:hypothetical protein
MPKHTKQVVDTLLEAEIARQVRHTQRMRERAGPLEFEPQDRSHAPEAIPEPEPEPPQVAARSATARGIWSGRPPGTKYRPAYSKT